MIDAGGIAGTLGGGSLGVIISAAAAAAAAPRRRSPRPGAVLGLAAAAYFTRDWGDSDAAGAGAVHAYLAPPEHGRGGIAGLAATW